MYSKCEVAEVIIYANVLTTEQRGRVCEYLTQKYGLAPQYQEPNTVRVITKAAAETTILDGITVRDGLNTIVGGVGAGVYVTNGSLSVANCIFSNNAATGSGAGVYIAGSIRGPCVFRNSRFVRNTSGLYGGAMYLGTGTTGTFENCVIRGNSSMDVGGGLYASAGAVVDNCLFASNLATNGTGAGMYCSSGTIPVTLRNSVFSNNAGYSVGGAYLAGPALVSNCVFSANAAENVAGAAGGLRVSSLGTVIHCAFAANNGPGLYAAGPGTNRVRFCTFFANTTPQYGALSLEEGGTVSHCIFWENSVPVYVASGRTLNISYCNVDTNVISRSGATVNYGAGIMNEDPLFASETEPYDVHLKSKSGRYIGPGLWVSDTVSSPCIDAGDPDEPFGAEPLPNGNRVNIGMYGNTPEASKRLWGLFLQVR